MLRSFCWCYTEKTGKLSSKSFSFRRTLLVSRLSSLSYKVLQGPVVNLVCGWVHCGNSCCTRELQVPTLWRSMHLKAWRETSQHLTRAIANHPCAHLSSIQSVQITSSFIPPIKSKMKETALCTTCGLGEISPSAFTWWKFLAFTSLAYSSNSI